MRATTIQLSINSKGIVLSQDRAQSQIITSRKWGLFLCHLASQQQLNRPLVTFDHLFQQATFSQGRKGYKTERTVAVKIDNFRRQMKTAGLIITKGLRGSVTTYAFEDCTIADDAPFAARLNHLRGSADALAFWIKPPLKTHLAWLFLSMRAKVAFANGHIDAALNYQSSALALTSDPFLNAATYAEIARISFRADRDLALDMRDQAMDFVESGVMTGAIAQIFAPRIRVSYAFQDDMSAEVQCQKLDVIAADYLSRGIDIAGLCRALNIRGNMRRRASNDAAGLPDFQLASALAITTGDNDLVQASLFNMLASLEFSDAVSPQEKIEGAELNSWFCAQFNIGKDSAQAELLLSQFYVEAGDFAQATATIKRAAALLTSERNATDVAFFLYATTNLRTQKAIQSGTPLPPDRIRAKLNRAGGIYKRVGNVIGTRKIERFLGALEEKP